MPHTKGIVYVLGLVAAAPAPPLKSGSPLPATPPSIAPTPAPIPAPIPITIIPTHPIGVTVTMATPITTHAAPAPPDTVPIPAPVVAPPTTPVSNHHFGLHGGTSWVGVGH